jgi:hypothetical protein
MRAAADLGTFAGAGYDPNLDHERLELQIGRIRSWALAREWFTLREASEDLERLYAPTLFPESSLSAQLRNLEKPASGRLRCKKQKRRREGARGPGAGIFEYRIRPEPQRPWLQLRLFVEKQGESAHAAARVDACSEPDDGRGCEEFFREARRIASESSK